MGIVPHGASLGVIVRRARVQVSQVLGSVLSNPQVSHCDSLLAVHLCTGHIHLVHVLVFILVLIQIVTLQTSYYHYLLIRSFLLNLKLILVLSKANYELNWPGLPYSAQIYVHPSCAEYRIRELRKYSPR